jgi:glycosyltransferase involved in cell wall biosynthesis
VEAMACNPRDGKKPYVMVVLPAFNAERTLAKTIRDIPEGIVDRILLVDDGSTDRTVQIATSLGLEVIVHKKNQGYGANQKTCYDQALASEAEIIVMLHPDYQYDARLIPAFIPFLQTGVCDLMLGNRIRTRREAIRNGMPPWKYIGNRALTLFENMLLGQNLGEWHSGFRMFHRKLIEIIPYRLNSDDFVFDTQFLVQAVHYGFRIGDAPVPVRYFEEASSINFMRSWKYGLETLKAVGGYIGNRFGLLKLPWLA